LGTICHIFYSTELKKCPVGFVSFLFCLLGAKILERLAKFSISQNCKSHYQFHDELAQLLVSLLFCFDLFYFWGCKILEKFPKFSISQNWESERKKNRGWFVSLLFCF